MSKHKFICFKCRISVKRELHPETQVKCPSCGSKCEWIGVKIPVPPKKNIKAWESLKHQLLEEESSLIENNKIEHIKRKHEIEKEIQKLELKPENSGRLSLIKQLKKELKNINA